MPKNKTPDLLIEYVRVERLTDKLLDAADELREARRKLHEKEMSSLEESVDESRPKKRKGQA